MCKPVEHGPQGFSTVDRLMFQKNFVDEFSVEGSADDVIED